MMQSMTGFGCREKEAAGIGQISVELRSLNHKFLEIALHLPAGFLFLEDRIKKEIEARIKRGRVTCVVNIAGAAPSSPEINKRLLKNYLLAIEEIREQFHIQDKPGINTLINLPGVLSVKESRLPKDRVWPQLQLLLSQALGDLIRTRQKEGQALQAYLKKGAATLEKNLVLIKARFRKVVRGKVKELASDEARCSFLKDSDINEELERLVFHIKNFARKLVQGGAVGKELDFIVQEMQREANTMGAKSCDTRISGKAVQLKSQIEKLREQIQNVE